MAVTDFARAGSPPLDISEVSLEKIAAAWAIPEKPDQRIVLTV